MIGLITSGVTNIITWFGQVISAITDQTSGAWKDIGVFVGISVAVMLVFLGVRIVKRLIKGY